MAELQGNRVTMTLPKKKQLGHFERLAPAMQNSLAGLKQAFKQEMAFRQEVYLFVVLTPIAILISEGFIEFTLLIFSIICILITELLNSAIEAVVDRVGFERHELSGLAKDLGSAAVFVAICFFMMVWAYKFITYFSLN